MADGRDTDSNSDERANQLRLLALALADAEARERKRLAQILHDSFQQLISAAKLKAGLVRRQSGESEVKEGIAHVERLLQQALDQARSLTVELSPPVLYESGLGPAIASIARDLEQRGQLHVAVSLDPSAEPELEQIRVLLFEAVRELLRNVISHANASAANVRLAVAPDGRIQVTVSDDGTGFDPAMLQVVTRAGESTSFGLLEIRERLGFIGGDLSVTSEPRRGTTVTLLVPAQLREPKEESASLPEIAKRDMPSHTCNASVRILLADDHTIFREGLVALLRQDPAINVVGEASDGLAAVELARKLSPDILLLDTSMPKLSGLEVAKILSKEMPLLKIVALSMHAESDMGRPMREAGAVAYVNKASATEALLAQLRDLVNPAM